MKYYMIFILVAIIQGCTKDDYASVPEEVSGYGLLSIDTNLSLKSTFTFDSLNRLDSFETCSMPESVMLKGYDSLLVITYRGVQLFKNGKFLFVHVKGAISASREDSVTLLIQSTLGLAKVQIQANLKPVILSFEFSKKIRFPAYDCFLNTESSLLNVKSKIYIECPNETGKLYYGWEKKQLIKPKCYIQ